MKVVLREALHARPASLVVRAAARFRARVEIRLERAARAADARSILEVLALAAAAGDALEIAAEGDDAEAAVRALAELVERGFDADLVPEVASGAAEGIGAGRAVVVGPLSEAATTRSIDDAIEAATADLAAVMEALPAQEAALFAPEKAMLAELAPRLRARIVAGEAAEMAVEAETASDMTDLLLDVRARILDALRGGDDAAAARRTFEVAARSGEALVAVVARPLTPSLVAELPASVAAIVAGEDAGGGTSHAAILARGRDVPLARVAEHVLAAIAEGDVVVVDTTEEPSRVWVSPSAALLAEANARRAERVRAREEAALASIEHLPIVVRVNVGSLRDEVPAGARGVGLLRTEIAFAGRGAPPSEVEQAALVRAVCAKAVGEPVVVRLFDAGGDKPLAWLRPPPDAPGVRGVELLFAHPEVLDAQLRAIGRARVGEGAGADVRVLIPMVRSAEDVERIRARAPAGLLVGAMIETPDAARAIEAIAAAADFVSIGTNDLAAEALGAPRQAATRALEPAVLRLIREVVVGAHAHGRAVTVCGEIAGDPRGARVLTGLGADGLSVSPARLATVRKTLAEATLEGCAAEARAALAGVGG